MLRLLFNFRKYPIAIAEEVWEGRSLLTRKNLAHHWIRSADRSAQSQSLYALSYRPTDTDIIIIIINPLTPNDHYSGR